MDLTTNYLGLRLRSPLVPSASPMSGEIDNILWMEDAGAGAVVLPSLFEEQLSLESYELHHHLTYGTESFPESLTYFPEHQDFRLGPEEYLNLIQKTREKVKIPIIASLNGSSLDGWTEYARMIEQAGATALELNTYSVHTDPELTSEQIEQSYINMLKVVKASVQIPVAIKLSPYFTNMANMAKRLDDAGADALVLFNRFYQPDINLETLEVEPHVLLSTPQAMRLPLRWIAILYGRINAHLAATSGIHNGHDVLKMLMAGANITMLCSVLLRHGIEHIKYIEQEIRQWMEKHEYESVEQLQGSMSQKHCPNPSAFERAQYMRALQTYQPDWGRVYEPSHYHG
ncbi:Dihydroorotate dehydrogenase [Trichormus variabilis ATCC 29413]|uniref:Dihydroorotate dehydrogenase n=2 Tax=Anabaena variabilis TaxID=264691 RepID=Q3M8N1_TRIV2|nr:MULTISPECIES: dihydroorotate dehydrogenase-like protein [Nostocaceae]ABA22655.1 Dihydroorotate dehydrogenase [Trichormus variabilis ATCC 29413]MBC1215907.1 dihydroorotate dehydrogenase-like protein [Trichormus variabilis ARAD]MBC1254119.1 dihydroorotate dehydrogenase-like protein [Trichormus variabilis V5]MBC1267070.1 dihydroorotate dehydrogenase-like protein [Trichormus variabilis FSR]MBC1303708.1 dihydroorotate dehydrogenase-like protein [Trichormus variabilis N2B]